ncbi:MAG: hypothetical protein JWQ08_1668 [Deinococcus sp.]|nr:hypothetical protein [Deinococcus sp.]
MILARTQTFTDLTEEARRPTITPARSSSTVPASWLLPSRPPVRAARRPVEIHTDAGWTESVTYAHILWERLEALRALWGFLLVGQFHTNGVTVILNANGGWDVALADLNAAGARQQVSIMAASL